MLYMFWCLILTFRLKGDPSVQVLAQDHRNDCLSNSIALLCAYSAQKWWIFLDPLGAIFVAIYIAVTWFRTGREQLMMLSGRSARPEFINRIIKVWILIKAICFVFNEIFRCVLTMMSASTLLTPFMSIISAPDFWLRFTLCWMRTCG